jgi:hypothetical protein
VNDNGVMVSGVTVFYPREEMIIETSRISGMLVSISSLYFLL